MQILVNVPASLPDAVQCTPEQFAHEARMAMAAKLYEMKRLSSGMAAALVGMGRVEFLRELHHYNVSLIDETDEELAGDVANA